MNRAHEVGQVVPYSWRQKGTRQQRPYRYNPQQPQQKPEQYNGVPITPVLLYYFKNDKNAVIEFLDTVQNSELGIIKQRVNDAKLLHPYIKKIQDDAAAGAKALEIDG